MFDCDEFYESLDTSSVSAFVKSFGDYVEKLFVGEDEDE